MRNGQDGLGVVGQDVLERRRVLQVELVKVVDGHDEVVQRLRRDQIPLHRRGIRILDQPEPELLRQELEVVDQAKVRMDADQPDVDSNQGPEDQLQNRFHPLWKLEKIIWFLFSAYYSTTVSYPLKRVSIPFSGQKVTTDKRLMSVNHAKFQFFPSFYDCADTEQTLERQVL